MKSWQRQDDSQAITKAGFRTVVHKQFCAMNVRITDPVAVLLAYDTLKEIQGGRE